MAKRRDVRRMLDKDPTLYGARVLEVGPNFTVEHREDIRRWEVMEGTAHRSLHEYLDDAIEAVCEMDPLVTIPEDVDVKVAG